MDDLDYSNNQGCNNMEDFEGVHNYNSEDFIFSAPMTNQPLSNGEYEEDMNEEISESMQLPPHMEMQQEEQQLESLKYIDTSISPPQNENLIQASNPIVIEDQQASTSRMQTIP